MAARRLAILGLLLSTSAWAGGPFPQLTCDTLPTSPLNINVNFETQVFPLLIGDCPGGGCTFSTCSNCHGGPPTTNNRLVINAGDVEATLLTLVDPDRDWIRALNPTGSRMYSHINCDAQSQIWRMPLIGNTMPLAQQAIIYDWIQEGARGTFMGLPISDVIFRNGVEGVRR
jgi:hypothetical protein